jgi:hypothetical protein
MKLFISCQHCGRGIWKDIGPDVIDYAERLHPGWTEDQVIMEICKIGVCFDCAKNPANVNSRCYPVGRHEAN